MTNAVKKPKQRVANVQSVSNLVAHPATLSMPSMTDGERADLTADIKANGQRDPIKVVDGKIVDGRERYLVCKTLGITPKVEFIDSLEGTTVGELVMSLNYHRRHLSDGQRAIIAARMATTSVGSNQNATGAVTQGQAAALCKTSRDSVLRAKAVLGFDNASLTQAVFEGRLDVSSAAAIAKDKANSILDLWCMSGEGMKQLARQTTQRRNAAKRAAVMVQVDAMRENNQPLPTGKKYGLIYADPAWDYLPEHQLKYVNAPLEKICAQPVPNIAEDNAVLAMWVPPSQLARGLAVVKAWGFEFKTCMVWDKEVPGQGQYFMNQHELLFIATRGKPPNRALTANPNIILFSVF